MYKYCERSGCDPLSQATLEAQQPDIRQQVWAILEMIIKTYVTLCVRVWKKLSLPNSLECRAQIIVVIRYVVIANTLFVKRQLQEAELYFILNVFRIRRKSHQEIYVIHCNFNNIKPAGIELLGQNIDVWPFHLFSLRTIFFLARRASLPVVHRLSVNCLIFQLLVKTTGPIKIKRDTKNLKGTGIQCF